MTSKISTGYLKTPSKMGPKHPNKNGNSEFDKDAFQELLNCPEKKKIVLQLLSQNKHIIEKHMREDTSSPVNKLKSQKKLESPTALFRRRALQQMNSSSSSTVSGSSRLDSPASSASSETVPLNQVLKGVIAYVEVKNCFDEDRSAGAKVVLKSMGAVVRDKFTRDVTHVVFKDGSYQTYQKAKLLKVHLVSILWIEFCRKTLQRQKEKLYPALKGSFEDETVVCSQMQKEYEEIIRDEYKKSIVQGTPLPSTAALISRRRTLMTASATECSSSDSFKTAQDEEDFSYEANTENIVFNEVENSLSGGNSNMELTCAPKSLSKMYTRRKTTCNNSTLSTSTTNATIEKSMSKNDSFTSNESVIFGRKSAKSKTESNKAESLTSMSSLRLSPAESNNKSTTSMSSLRLSTEKTFSHVSSEMPELRLSSEKNVPSSDDSEILSPVKTAKTKRNAARNLLVRVERLPKGSETDSLSKKPARRLYDPDASIRLSLTSVDDEKEREERRQVWKQKQNNATGTIPLANFLLNRTFEEEEEEEETQEGFELEGCSPPKKTKKPAPVLNESADEQRDLLNEVLKAKNEMPARRKSIRIQSRTQTKAVSPVNRRSTLEFVSNSQLTGRKKAKKSDKMPTIVCTMLHRGDVQMFAQIVKKLGRFVIEDEVSERTTHLVAGEPKRTINMLRAISRGCWVLKFEWVLQSLENRKWLPEEDFELTEFSPAVQKSRLERQAFGSNYALDVFETAPPIYVAPSTIPRSSDLKELITTCKGKVVSAARMAKIIVGQYVEQDETKCVNETWVLDSITFYRRMSFKGKYLLKNKRQSVVV